MKAILVAILFTLHSVAQADVVFSVEHQISLKILQNLGKALQDAKNRPAEVKNFPTILPIVDENLKRTPLTLFCPQLAPDLNGDGCNVFVAAGKGTLGELSVSFKKALSEKSINEAVSKMAEILKSDPNSFEEWNHQAFGNPFNQASDPTHMYCIPAGIAPNKSWDCRLFVTDTSVQ